MQSPTGRHLWLPIGDFDGEPLESCASPPCDALPDRLLERPGKITEQLEKKMLEVRRGMRAENLEQWRQDVVGEVRSLLKA